MTKIAGDLVSGVAAMDAGKFTEGVMKTNATNAERDGSMDASRIRDGARLAMGRQVAGLAASGLDMSGSVLDAVRESAIEAQLEIATRRRKAASDAQAMRTQGKIAYSEGYNAMSGHMISVAGKMIDFATNMGGAGGGAAGIPAGG